jgi:hypothetical protein
MAKATPRNKDAEEYFNPNLVVSIEPARDANFQVMSPAYCLVTMVNGRTFEIDGDVDAVIQALKVP